MSVNVRIRNGMCPDPTTGDGGATEGDIRGSFSDIIGVVGVKDLAGGHCAVTQNSPAALSVLVADGVVYIPNADYDELDSNTVKFWEAVIKDADPIDITENTSGSTRIDLICAKMDTAITPDEHASNIATLVAVAGTPGAGAPTLPDNYAKLAEVEVANGASTIVNADITDSRVQAKINSDYIGASVSVTTKGDLQTYSTVPDRLPVGGNGQILSANSSKDTGLEWINGVTADSTTTFTNKNLTSETNILPSNGWTPARETWTYASATTITVPSGAASKYKKGDKIKLTQTTVKYFYIVGVADTLLTVTGGSDYTVANAAISANYYSHQENPIGFPNYFNFTNTITSEVGTITDATGTSKFSIIGNILYISGSVSITDNGTGAVKLRVSLPINPLSSATSVGFGANSYDGYFRSGFFMDGYWQSAKYDNTYGMASGTGCIWSGFYII
jgi:hypothetical protein